MNDYKLIIAAEHMSDKGYELSTHEKQAEFTKQRKRSSLLYKIEDYLNDTGSFNPEHMQEGEVRQLILDMQEYLTTYEVIQ
jgi:hypothetical protein